MGAAASIQVNWLMTPPADVQNPAAAASLETRKRGDITVRVDLNGQHLKTVGATRADHARCYLRRHRFHRAGGEGLVAFSRAWLILRFHIYIAL